MKEITQHYEELGWCLIPPYIMAREDLSPIQKMFYGRIQGLIGKKGYCYASNRWLGAQIGVEAETITSILHKLQNLGLAQVQVIRKNGDGVVLERRIFLTPPSPMAVGDLPYGGRGPSPMAVGDHIKGRVKGRESNLNINTATAVPSNGESQGSTPVDGEDLPQPVHLAVKRTRTSPSIPYKPPQEETPEEEKRPSPILQAGMRLLRDNGSIGFSSLCKKVLGSSVTKYTVFQSATPLGKLVVEQQTSEELVREVFKWLETHAYDKYTPTFSDAFSFAKKFGAIVSVMRKSQKEERPKYGPLSTRLTPEESKAKYGGNRNGDCMIDGDGKGYVWRDGEWRHCINGVEVAR